MHDMPGYQTNNLRLRKIKDAILKTFNELSKDEQIKILSLYKPLETYFCMKKLNQESRIELIGKVGIWLIQNKEHTDV